MKARHIGKNASVAQDRKKSKTQDQDSDPRLGTKTKSRLLFQQIFKENILFQ